MAGTLENTRRGWLLALLGIAWSGVAPAEVLEEMVVTAQKREQNLQDVGVSVTAFTGDQVRELGFTRSNDVVAQMPGVTFNSVASGGTFSLPTIRGVSQNDFAQTQEAPNAVYVDGVYMSFLTGLNFSVYDMERIEVLRGPQGTLYGRNATGGLFHYITKKPTDTFEAFADLSYGSYDEIRSEAAISGPIMDGLKARLSFTSDHYDPWWENRIGQDAFDRDSYAIRGQLLAEPTDDLTIHFTVSAGAENNKAGTYSGVGGYFDQFRRGVDVRPDEDRFGFGPGTDVYGYVDTNKDAHNSAFNDVGFMDRKILSLAGTVTWDFENFTLTSITGYHDFSYGYLEDCDGTPTGACQFGSGLSDADQFSEELRINGEMDRLRWTAGFYYLVVDNDAYGSFASPEFSGTDFAFDVQSNWSTDTESWAIFGQLEYDLTDQWTVIGGLRWTEETKQHRGRTVNNECGVLVCGPVPPGFVFYNFDTENPVELLAPFAGVPDVKQSVGDWAGKIELDYKPTDDLLVYGSVTRGNKGPGYNVPLDGFLGIDATPFKEETLTAYELGFKSTFWDGKARLNGAAFYYDYNDYQAFNFVGLAQIIRNKDAELYGAEFELTLNPAEGWDLLFGISLLEAEVYKVNMPDGVTTLTTEPPQAPSITINGLARKEWSAFNGTVAVQMDFNYWDDYYSGIANAPTTLEPENVIGNGRISYTTGDGAWDFAFFVRNIADADIQNYTFDLTITGDNVHSFMPPRWFGASVRYTWQ